MRASVCSLLLGSLVFVTAGVAASACSSSSSGSDGEVPAGDLANVDDVDEGSPPPTSADGGVVTGDGAAPDDDGPAEVQLVGRFTPTDGVGPSFAFPGSRIVARFRGTGATVKLSQTDGFTVGHSYFNVIVDGVVQAEPLEVAGAGQSYAVASGLSAGAAHTIELEKRTEANLGVVRFEGFTFDGGSLLGSAPRPSRRIEFLSDSTIDGFGIDGTRADPLAANYCAPDGTGAPPRLDNAGESMSAVAAASLGADYFLVAYSGKGITKNESGSDTLFFPTLYDRTLPNDATTRWDRASWIPDAVVVSLGGVDFDGRTTAPDGFGAGYGGLVDEIRASYPSAYIVLTVWSQIKDDTIPTRTAMKNALDAIVAARPSDARLSVYAFPQAVRDVDETGCQFHGNVEHHRKMAADLVTQLSATIPGW